MGTAGKRASNPQWLTEGGHMGRLVRHKDWNASAMGALSAWPSALRTAVNFCLDSDRPAAVIWGEHYSFIPNDAYLQFYAKDEFSRSDAAAWLGLSFRDFAPLPWEEVSEAVTLAFEGQGTEVEGRRFFLERGGRQEEHFFRFTFSPVRDDEGQIVGLYHGSQDCTQEVLAERRWAFLGALGDEAEKVTKVEQIGPILERVLSAASADLPFFALYIRDANATELRRVVSLGFSGTSELPEAVPDSIDVVEPIHLCGPFSRAAQNCEVVELTGLARQYQGFHAGPYEENPDRALIIPVTLANVACPLALILAGVSARRPLDEIYRSTFFLLRDAIANLLSRARAFTEEVRRREANARLRLSEESYRAIVQQQREMVSRYRRDGTILFANEAYARMRDTTAEELAGSNFWHFIDPADRPRIERLLDSLSPDQTEVRIENALRTDRGTRWVLWTTSALQFDEQGHAVELQATGTDITERKKIELSLKRSEENLHLALRGANAGVWMVELPINGESNCSEELPVVYGYEPGTRLTREQWYARLHPDERERVPDLFSRAVTSGASDYSIEFRILHPERGERWILHIGRVHRNAAGEAVQLTGMDMDITERKQNEEILRASEAKFRNLAEAVPTLVWVSQADGNVNYVNPRWTEFTGQSPEEALGFGWLATLHPDDRGRLREFWEHCIVSGEVFEGEARYRRHDGEYLWHHFKTVRSFDEKGEISAWYGASLDIHSQKIAEQAVRDSEGHFRLLADSAPAMLWLMDPAGRCTFISKGWLDFTGQTAEEVLGRGWIDAVHPGDRRRVSRSYRGKRERLEEYTLDYRVRRADGQFRWVLDTGRPRLNEGGELLGYVGSVIDVHERKQAEDMLRESEQRFRTLADNISQLAWMADPQGWIFWFNQRWYDFTGTTQEEVQGWSWTRILHADQAEQVMAKIKLHWESGEPWEDTFLMRRFDGSYRWFLSRATPIRDESGRITRWFGTNTDVTDQRDAEAALKEADRRKDEFLATLAHELRNPLAPLRNGLEIMRLAAEDPQSMARARKMMERQLEHMVRLIDDLLDLSRISRGKITLHKRRMSLEAVIQQAVETSRPAIEQAAHQLTVNLPPERLFVNADPTRLAQVFSNLLNNAAKFTDRGGSIWLTVERREGDVRILVRDNGIGIRPDMLSRVFDMFIQVDPTLERTHGGLGIGLSLVKGLVEMHDGSISAQSDGPGLGSEFCVCLPLLLADGEEDFAAAVSERRREQRRRILVVDDNRDSAASMATMMELMGNEARTAHDGLEGLGMAATYRPDLVFLDIGMPKLNGYDVARKIREQEWGKDMVLVALTGWGQDEDRRRSQDAGFDYHLVKPVELAALEQVLNGGDSEDSEEEGT